MRPPAVLAAGLLAALPTLGRPSHEHPSLDNGRSSHEPDTMTYTVLSQTTECPIATATTACEVDTQAGPGKPFRKDLENGSRLAGAAESPVLTTIVSAAPTAFPSTGAEESQELALKRDWDLDAKDLVNLELQKSLYMVYMRENVPLGSKPSESSPIAWVNINKTDYPMVQTVTSDYFSNVWCDIEAGWIKMQFLTSESYEWAWDNWSGVREDVGDYVVVTSEESCQNWNSTAFQAVAGGGMRNFVRATSEERLDNERVIRCEIQDISFQDAVGPENPVEVEFENFSQGKEAGGNPLSVLAEDGEGNAEGFVQKKRPGPGPVTSDPSGDSGFDTDRDSQYRVVNLEAFDAGLLAAFNITTDDFFGDADLLAKRGVFGKVKQVLRKTRNIVKDAVEKAGDTAKTVANAVLGAAEKATETLLGFNTVNRTVTAELDLDTTRLGDIVTTPFEDRQGYVLFSAGLATIGNNNNTSNQGQGGINSGQAGKVEVFCVDCGVQANLYIKGRVVFIAAKLTFKEGFIQVHGNIAAGLGFGIVAEVATNFEFEKQIVSIPLTPFAVPGILVLGPKIDLSAGAGVELAATGELFAGAEASWRGVDIKIDLVNPEYSSVTGLIPVIDPFFGAGGLITLTSEVFLKLGIGIGINVLNGLFDQSIELIDKPGFALSAGAGVSFSDETDAGRFAEGDCAGLEVSLGFTNEISANVFDLAEIILDSRSFEVFERCISFVGGNSRGTRSEKLLGNSSTVFDTDAPLDLDPDSGIVMTSMFLRDERHSLQLRAAPNGNTYVVPKDKASSDEEETSGLFAAGDEGGVAFGDFQGRLFHGYKDTIALFGVSRLRLHEPSKMPGGAELIVFSAVPVNNDTTAQDSLVLASDLIGNIFFPIVCVYEGDSVYPKVFISNTTDVGVDTLMANTPDILQDVTGTNVKSCGYVPVTN